MCDPTFVIHQWLTKERMLSSWKWWEESGGRTSTCSPSWWTREMASWVNSENLNSVPSIHLKPGVVMHTGIPITGEAETGRSMGLPSQPAESASYKWKRHSKRNKRRNKRRLTTVTYTHVCTHTHTQTTRLLWRKATFLVAAPGAHRIQPRPWL